MSFRPQGHAETNANFPRAHAVCDACGFRYNLDKLQWRVDWRGPKLQNLRLLVCPSCVDDFQPNGQKTIILPPDPIPVVNARPEQYVADNNPLSAIGANPSSLLWQYGSQIGNMTAAGGVPAAFDGSANKPDFMSAMISVSNSSYDNYVGINWSGYPATTPSSLGSPTLTHTLSSFTLTAPNNSTFGSTAYVIQGSQDSSTWTDIASGQIAGTIGEIISGSIGGGRYQYHRVGFYMNTSNILTSSDGTILTSSTGEYLTDDGGPPPSLAVAQVSFSVADGSSA